MSAHLSVCPRGTTRFPNWTEFHEILMTGPVCEDLPTSMASFVDEVAAGAIDTDR
jgi:hypothetical protein